MNDSTCYHAAGGPNVLKAKMSLRCIYSNAIVLHKYFLQAATQGLQSLQRYSPTWHGR